MAHDVTARRQVEEEVAAQRTQLAHLDRVAILAELSGSLAHELTQPLAAMLANARAGQRFVESATRITPDAAPVSSSELASARTAENALERAAQPALPAQGSAPVPEIMTIFGDIVADLNRSNAIVQSIRSLIRRDDPRPAPLDLNEVVGETVTFLRGTLQQRRVTVTSDLAPGLPPLVADRVQLQQVLLNLLVNASEAMADTPVAERQVVITTSATADGVALTVKDAGPGIKEVPIDAVFEPFTTSKSQGIGLGLTISRSIVRAIGGRIWVTNNADRGATFHVSLPSGARAADVQRQDAEEHHRG